MAGYPYPPGYCGECARNFQRWQHEHQAAKVPWQPSRANCLIHTPFRQSRAMGRFPVDNVQMLHKWLSVLHRAGDRIITFYSRDQAVTQANIAECATHHHFMVATARPIGVEITLFNAMFDQILACRACCGKATCRRDVVGCNRVIKHCQNTRTANILDKLRLKRHILEEWWLLNIG